MSALIIVGVFILLYWVADFASRKEKANNYRNSNSGSRQVEKEEWERWTKQLYDEYCELAGIEKTDFEKLGMHPFTLEIRYGERHYSNQLHWDCDLHKIFGLAYRNFYEVVSSNYSVYQKAIDFPRFTDRNVIEQLRKKHGLPSDVELNSTILGNADGSTNYKCLYDLMYQCVIKAVRQRGYKYGGTDYVAENQRHQNLKYLHAKYDWMDPDKKDKK